MKFFRVAVFIAAANTFVASAVPIPPTQIISPYETRFAQRKTAPHRVRSVAAGLVSRIPEVISRKRADDDDIFLARALEGSAFASAGDISNQRSQLKRFLHERAPTSDESSLDLLNNRSLDAKYRPRLDFSLESILSIENMWYISTTARRILKMLR
ncbi:hypothetical protein C8R45DRAFT_929669 [Mycena sanguinolenta]|nr:hypothetical protein C8R45DRAFT_929669 [Mycena sanguinolenta]